jgi:hypothetical protein
VMMMINLMAGLMTSLMTSLMTGLLDDRLDVIISSALMDGRFHFFLFLVLCFVSYPWLRLMTGCLLYRVSYRFD